ncbi:MAG TPA: hypothetical protein VGA09_18185 [Candidatus Binatia bacterium]
MEKTAQRVFFLKNELAGEEDSLGKFLFNIRAEILKFRNQIDSETVAILRIPSEAIGKLYKAF